MTSAEGAETGRTTAALVETMRSMIPYDRELADVLEALPVPLPPTVTANMVPAFRAAPPLGGTITEIIGNRPVVASTSAKAGDRKGRAAGVPAALAQTTSVCHPIATFVPPSSAACPQS
jgi:hypothetical protein